MATHLILSPELSHWQRMTLTAALRTADGEFPRLEQEAVRIIAECCHQVTLAAFSGVNSKQMAEMGEARMGRIIMAATIKEAARIVTEQWI